MAGYHTQTKELVLETFDGSDWSSRTFDASAGASLDSSALDAWVTYQSHDEEAGWLMTSTDGGSSWSGKFVEETDTRNHGDVLALSDSEAWAAVGENVYEWDGADWCRHEVGLTSIGGGSSFYADNLGAAFLDESDGTVFVGKGDEVAFWDGSEWTRLELSLGPGESIRSAALIDGEPWLAVARPTDVYPGFGAFRFVQVEGP